MAEQNAIIWLNGIAKKQDQVEKICPEIHVRQNQWQPEWNNAYGGSQEYPYISDYECFFNYPMDDMGNLHLHAGDNEKRSWEKLQDAKKHGTSIKITELAHFTNVKAAVQIVDDHGFRGGLKKINENDEQSDVKANLSWWIPVFTDAEKNSVREHLGEVIKLFAEENKDKIDALKNQYATSDAFQPNRLRYGDYLFQYGINELCDNYSKFIRCAREPCYKILGTFAYKKEVMHVVLVCNETDGAGQFAGYPDVISQKEDFNKEAVITRDDNGNWYWRPQATGGGEIRRLQAHLQNYPLYRRWEHVAFAFHIPIKKIMLCDSIRDHLKFIDPDRRIVDLPVDSDDSEEED